MKPVDVFDEMAKGQLDEQGAHALFDQATDYLHSGGTSMFKWHYELLKMSKVEFHAIMNGGEYGLVASWRKNGWPKFCCKCKQDLRLEIYGWKVEKNEGEICIRHIKCDETYLAQLEKIAAERGLVNVV